MRRALFWIMIVILLALVTVIAVAAKQHTSPKMVLQNWFGRSISTGSVTTGYNSNDTMTDVLLSGNTTMEPTGSTTINTVASGELSDAEKAETHSFLNSLIQQ